MGEGPQVPGGWDSTEPSEPPAALLRRAISHVESLLHRLEPTADGDEPPPGPDAPASFDIPVAVSEVAPEPTPAEQPPATVPPFSAALGGGEEAETLRSTLRLHEEADRRLVEANALRAEAAELVAVARREAAALIEAATADADQLRQAALDHHADQRSKLTAVADEARTSTQQSVGQLLDDATREAERILERARDSVAGVRSAMHRLIDGIDESLRTFNAGVESIGLLHEDAPDGSTNPATESTPRPLGPLFGAQRR